MATDLQAQFPIGTRVLLRGRHPHAGKTGEICRYETLNTFPEEGPQPVIALDDGLSCFVLDINHMQKLSGKAGGRRR